MKEESDSSQKYFLVGLLIGVGASGESVNSNNNRREASTADLNSTWSNFSKCRSIANVT